MIKKLIPLFLALAAMFCIVPMRGDTPPDKGQEIPIRKVDKSDLIRSLNDLFVYYDGYCLIQTSILSDLGIVEMTVTNLTTGETWSDTFDTAISPHFLQISGAPGFYEITYLTSFGDLYEGQLIID